MHKNTHIVKNNYEIKGKNILLKIEGKYNGLVIFPKYYLNKIKEYYWSFKIAEHNFAVRSSTDAYLEITQVMHITPTIEILNKSEFNEYIIFNFTAEEYSINNNIIPPRPVEGIIEYKNYFIAKISKQGIEKKEKFSKIELGIKEAYKQAVEQRKLWELEFSLDF